MLGAISECPCIGWKAPACVVTSPDFPIVNSAVIGKSGIGECSDIANNTVKFSGSDVPFRTGVNV